MSGGLVGLLDDIAALAKLAAASIDDLGAAAGRASAKAAGVIIDDTAVTPAYVHGLAAERELPIVRRIAFLFLIDAIGGGFLGSALLSYFFAQQFAVSAATLALLFAAGRSLAAFSHLGAAWLAARIGLVNTMVWTHVPSSLILFTIGVAPDFTIAAVLFLVREALNEMDVPTRQSYVMAVVQPEERLATAGVTNLVRACGWAIAPVFAGLLMQTGSLAAPLYCGASLKILYDVLLWRDFRRLKPPEES